MPGNEATLVSPCANRSPESGTKCTLPFGHDGDHSGVNEQRGQTFWVQKSTEPTVEPPVDMVNHPPHYTSGPVLNVERIGQKLHTIECIEVIRHITDMRLATAMKYIWRVAFGGKANDREDIEKAIFYLKDWLDNPT